MVIDHIRCASAIIAAVCLYPRRTRKDDDGEFYGRYRGRILRLAAQATSDGAWKAKLREILAKFDNDCRELSASGRQLLRSELANQIDHEVLLFSDPEASCIVEFHLPKYLDSRHLLQKEKTRFVLYTSAAPVLQFTEPTLSELLEDPVIRRLMTSDGVDLRELRTLLTDLRVRLARDEASPGEPGCNDRMGVFADRLLSR